MNITLPRAVIEQALEALEQWNTPLYKRGNIITALRTALEQPQAVQVSPLEFTHMVIDKEDMVGKPIFWAEWPNKE